MAFPTIESLEFDFEEYALTEGIPETKDPLPYYRKSGSIFAAEDENENAKQYDKLVFTSAKYDPRLRTVVCRHWLKGLCMKGNVCEFLHQYDLSKMPYCHRGEKCCVKDCPFRHMNKDERLECTFYQQGFCMYGRSCHYKHVRRERADVPDVADFTLGLKHMIYNNEKNNRDGEGPWKKRRLLPKDNNSKRSDLFKVKLCKHFMHNGNCPFGNGCHFAHGQEELRTLSNQ